ncbi:type VI secretion system lipoprotein TssJ [Luteimonas yindakuii]|uniref:Type VI secretion system lipoprotein TssJ n=1 Tax=Luteimonas yindakuii TaxID=2565782 RepID=A0A4Z1RKT5_9GAMM|nr:type VI secretion system lipoprotein TssJ [Luteimonas yindakuii]
MDTSLPARLPPRSPPALPLRAAAGALCIALAVGGCASSGGLVDRTLQTVGLRDTAPQGPQLVAVELMAGGNLNAGNGLRGLALVVKTYQLRDTRRFEQAPFEAFLDDARERAALGEDLVAVNEVVLAPGQREVLQERLVDDATVLGVVALFQAPAAGRWRLAFDPENPGARRDGIRIGLHACAMTTSSTALATRLPGDASSLASVRCQHPGR